MRGYGKSAIVLRTRAGNNKPACSIRSAISDIREDAQQIGSAHDPDDFAVADDRHALDAVPRQQSGNFGSLSFFSYLDY